MGVMRRTIAHYGIVSIMDFWRRSRFHNVAAWRAQRRQRRQVSVCLRASLPLWHQGWVHVRLVGRRLPQWEEVTRCVASVTIWRPQKMASDGSISISHKKGLVSSFFVYYSGYKMLLRHDIYLEPILDSRYYIFKVQLIHLKVMSDVPTF